MSNDQETAIGTSGLECPQCKTINPPAAVHCEKCQTPLVLATSVTTTGGVVSGWSKPAPVEMAAGSLAALKPGAVLAGRYEIIQMLGEGGMGAVYKARDTELDRLVAVKVIRPELAGRPEILQRFKQELILARQVTHKNVIRIFDLGQSDGMKYITMEYVEGQDLKHILRQKRQLPPEEAVNIVEQVARALEAAHAEGVVHRDLKPQNIMIDERGRILVMDFGIARSMEMTGMTQTGALVGTPEYMSPEQAKGEKVDTRSDLFPLGIIFYELLTGKSPYPSDTAMGALLKRIQEPAKPPVELDASIPKALSDAVAKCLEREPAQRYQSAGEFIRDLELWRDPTGGTQTITVIQEAAPGVVSALRHWKWAAAGLGVLLLAVAGLFVFREKTAPKTPAKQKVVTLLMADFNNATGEPVFDGTLEPMFTLAMEGASFISSPMRRDQALVTAKQLQAGATKLDESLARLVAGREGISVVVAGSIARQGEGYVVSVKAVDALTGKVIASQENKAANKEKVLAIVGKLAAPIRKALGDATPESVQLAAAETYSAASLEAAHSYAIAQELRFAGKAEEAGKNYLKAVELDPKFGSAYAGLAVMHANLGQRQAAEKHFQMALASIDRMTDREKYRARGQYYLAVKNPRKALDEFSALLKQYPADIAGRANLALAYTQLHEMARAVEEQRHALESYPKSLLHRNNSAQYTLYAGDFDTAAREARAVMELSPTYLKAYRILAIAELAQGKVGAASEAYGRLRAVNPLGASFASIGLADVALYEGRVNEAVAILEKSVNDDLAGNQPAAAGKKFAMLASANLLLGRKPAALVAADRAINWSKEVSALFPAARVYLEAGQEAKARALASELSKRLEPDPQAFAKLIEGEALLKRGSAREAIKLIEEANKIADTWVGRFDLGRAYLEAGAFTEADSEFDKCLKRRGEAAEVYVDGVPTYHYLPPTYYYLGRAREGLKSPGAAESYKTFLGIKEKAEPDPLVGDARKRLAAK